MLESMLPTRRPFRSAWAPMLTLTLALAAGAIYAQQGAGANGRQKELKVKDVFTRFWDDAPVTPAKPPQPIRSAPPSRVAPRAKLGEPGAIRLYVNDERNSRAGGALGYPAASAPPLAIHWKADLRAGMNPRAVIATRDQVVVFGSSLWSLFDSGGRHLATNPLGSSEVVLDPPHSLLFAANNAGLIVGYHLSHGQSVFSSALHYGNDFARPFLARRDRLLITVGIKKDIDQHGPPPEEASVEVVDLGDPAAPKSWDQPGGAVSTHDLLRETRILVTAMNGDAIWMATQDRLFRANLSLDIESELTGSFTPLEIALDETGNIYLTVDVQGRYSLWMLTPQGERLYAFDFPPGAPAPPRPAVVGYDHTAYVLSGRQVLSIAPDGKANWTRTALAEIVGAVITADDVLLVSEGDSVSAWDARGQRRVLYKFPGERIASAPTLVGGGDLLVATEEHLYRLGMPR
jgi:hypothetical protein